MSLRAVFIALVIATALIVAALLVNSRRPRVVTEQPTAQFVRATGKCAECHSDM
jgi:hydroxylamine dehydrogenase